jgi:hypothetical protein
MPEDSPLFETAIRLFETAIRFDALMELEGETGVRFVGGYLNNSSAEIRDEAALSLGVLMLLSC